MESKKSVFEKLVPTLSIEQIDDIIEFNSVQAERNRPVLKLLIKEKELRNEKNSK